MYRPRDINRKEQDSRGVFASMHSDSCPITSIRGKCIVKHRSDIEDIDEFKKQKDSFYFSQMYDRYIHRYYDVIPTKAVINVPESVKKVLDERWKFIIVELGKGKEFTSAVKTCKRCSGYCANDNSVDCAVCKSTYHMNCVQPPLQKKPARGFAWSCGPCSRKQERMLEARNTPIIEGEEEEEYYEEEERDAINTTSTSPAPGDPDKILVATKDQIAHAQMWPYRYLGIHCKPTDALDYDDRIYPRASSRIGARHQATTLDWPGRPFQFVKPMEFKKRYSKGAANKKDAKLSKETLALMEADKKEREQRPKWVVDQPAGYVERGKNPHNSDAHRTATLLFKLPEVGEQSSRGGDDNAISKPGRVESDMDAYMVKAKKIALNLGLPEYHTNFLDRAVQLYCSTGYKSEEALVQLNKTSLRRDLKQPHLNKEELKRFDEAVVKYGSQLGDITRTVKTQKFGDIVRFYYVWKKTDHGKAIWGSREDTKSKKHVKVVEGTFLDDVADDADDSAFDNDKAIRKKKGFMCKFCSTKESRFWRRAPLVTPGQTVAGDGNNRNKDKSNQLMLALCGRCASHWRKYAMRYENIEEVAKKLVQTGGRATKRKADEELFRELVDAHEVGHIQMGSAVIAVAQSIGLEIAPEFTLSVEDPAKKRLKIGLDGKPSDVPAVIPTELPKKKEKPLAPEPPPLIPEAPTTRDLPCAVCLQMDIAGDERYSCRNCKLTVHKNCYGIPEGKQVQKWNCDCCTNDAANQFSTDYACTLCPSEPHEVELFEQARTLHKKKTERDREKERLERELFLEVISNYQKQQEELGRPIFPREALKSTAGYRWMHAICAIWTPCIKFWDAKLLDKPEGMLDIASSRFGEVCKICKIGKGVCAHCPKCSTPFHPSCAQQAGHTLGFFVTPVKGSRKDVVSSAHFGNESGHVEAVIYCAEHEATPGLHPMYEVFQDGTTALQTFVRSFKQADPTFTGTMRKAAAVANSVKSALAIRDLNISHRNSLSNGIVNHKSSQSGILHSDISINTVIVKIEEVDDYGDRIIRLQSKVVGVEPPKVCRNCTVDVSPKWHKYPTEVKQTNGFSANDAADDCAFYFYCHKCHMRKRDEEHQHQEFSDTSTENSVQALLPTQSSRMGDWTAGMNTAQPVPLPAAGHWQPSIAQIQSATRPSPLQPSLLNGTSASPSLHHSLPVQLPTYGTAPAPFAYSNGYDRRDVHASSSPHAFGHSTSDSNYNRRTSESLATPAVINQYTTSHHGSPGFQAQTLIARPSPPAYRSNNAPTGPPRPSDNPFYAPPMPVSQPYHTSSLDRPRSQAEDRYAQQQSHPYETRNGVGRDSARDRDRPEQRPVVNGASASPSLKNLLH